MRGAGQILALHFWTAKSQVTSQVSFQALLHHWWPILGHNCNKKLDRAWSSRLTPDTILVEKRRTRPKEVFFHAMLHRLWPTLWP